MMKWIMNNKIIAGIIVIALITVSVFGFFTYTEVGQEIVDDVFGSDIDSDLPAGQLIVTVTDVGSGTEQVINVPLDHSIPTLTTFKPLTTVEIAPIIPGNDYTIEFVVVTSVSLDNPGSLTEILVTRSLEGNYYGEWPGGIRDGDYLTSTGEFKPTVTTQHPLTGTDSASFVFTDMYYGGSTIPINGNAFEGSSFRLFVFSEAVEGSGLLYDFTLSVSDPGTLSVTIEDISATTS